MTVKGKDIILHIEKDGMQVPICCARDFTINISNDDIEVTKPPNSTWRTYMGGMNSYTINSNNLTTVSEGISFGDLFNYMSGGVIVQWIAKANSTTEIFFSGKIKISRLSLNAPYSDISTYTMDAVGDGVLNIENPYSIIMVGGLDGIVGTEDDEMVGIADDDSLLPINYETKCK